MQPKEWIEGFSEIAESLIEKKSLDSVLDTIGKTACSFFNASASSIMLFDKQKEYLTIARSFNLSADYLKVVKVRRDEEIAGRVCQEKKIRFVPNILQVFEKTGNSFTVDWVKKEGLVSMICAPFIIKGEAIGVLNIYFRSSRDVFQDTASLDFFAKLAALSIEHGKLIDEADEKSKIVLGLEEIGLVLASSFKFEKIVELFLSNAVSISEVDTGTLVLVDEIGGKVSEAFEYSREKNSHRRYLPTGRLTEGISGEIIRTRLPVIINEVKSAGDFSPLSIMVKHASIAGLPLIAREKLIGILFVHSSAPKEFEKNTVDYLTMLCSQAAVALDNTSLYRRLSREAMDMAILYEVGQSFLSTLEFDQLLINILRRLVDLFGFLNLAVFLVDEEKKELKLRAFINYPEKINQMKLEIGKVGITGHVAATRQMYYAPDVSRDPFYMEGVKEAKSEVCFPLVVGERLIGVLDVESPVYDGFSQDDINLLSTLSAQIAIASENALLYEETKRMSLTDPLTGLPNRRSFESVIDAEIKRSERYRRHFAILMIDFDNFKGYNDRFGHLAGDGVLQQFARLVKESIRDVDNICRYGGDEFIAVLPETESTFALEVAQRMAARVESQFKDSAITLSIGIATFPDDGKVREDLVKMADRACYDAKQLGGNRVNFPSG